MGHFGAIKFTVSAVLGYIGARAYHISPSGFKLSLGIKSLERETENPVFFPIFQQKWEPGSAQGEFELICSHT